MNRDFVIKKIVECPATNFWCII